MSGKDEALPVCHFCNSLLVENNEQGKEIRTHYVDQVSDLTRELLKRLDLIQKEIPEDGDAPHYGSREEKERIGRVNAEIWEGLTQLRQASAVALEVTSRSSTFSSSSTLLVSDPNAAPETKLNDSYSQEIAAHNAVSLETARREARELSLSYSAATAAAGEKEIQAARTAKKVEVEYVTKKAHRDAKREIAALEKAHAETVLRLEEEIMMLKEVVRKSELSLKGSVHQTVKQDEEIKQLRLQEEKWEASKIEISKERSDLESKRAEWQSELNAMREETEASRHLLS